MSFYGNVFYEFKNLFQKFKFLNSGLDESNINIDTLNSTVNGTVATQNWDTLHIDTGNRWIGLQSMPENGAQKGVTIFHRAPGGTTSAEASFAPFSEGDATVLNADQKFETLSLNVDSAGHVASVGKVAYQLPSSADIVNAGLTSYYDSRGIEVECAKAEGEGDVIELVPGQEIDFTTLNLTSKGIVSGFSSQTYKLPMSDSEKDYADLSERVEQAEITLGELVENIPTTYSTIESVGVVDDLYSTPPEENKFASITQGIGNLQQSSALITNDNETVVPISEQLIQLYNIVAQKTAEVATFATAIEGLQARVRLLESQIEELTK